MVPVCPDPELFRFLRLVFSPIPWSRAELSQLLHLPQVIFR